MCSNEELIRLKGLGDLTKKRVETKKDKVYLLVFFSYQTCISSSSCYYNSWESILWYEHCEESFAQSNGRSIDEWQFDCVH